MTAEAALADQWRSLLSRYSRIAHDLDRELQSGHGLTVSEYEALDQLLCRPPCKVRVQDLVESMHLSQSALSRTVARLEKCGLVERAMCDTDRRGVFVTPTEEGRRVHGEARPTYLQVLARHLS
ncbi:MarR family transcriptional regulator [Streptomyces sp. DSM 44917]|uniref:MarR family transcriptional regulator n=1 Tax=Streptomyces boetiae TaxID=3075541 RepID=A0ABU2LGB8_9ACTN|nr:MarR family transcriptional regulator [Streptomyces sp. DSM 44917]MDT0310629.1 MarR family transcriptional regulator [Streptomyces sp. DSM 44917]